MSKPAIPYRDPLLDEALRALSSIETTFLANKSGLSRSTIANWRSGKTRRPQSISLQFALRAAGYDLAIVKKG